MPSHMLRRTTRVCRQPREDQAQIIESDYEAASSSEASDDDEYQEAQDEDGSSCSEADLQEDSDDVFELSADPDVVVELATEKDIADINEQLLEFERDHPALNHASTSSGRTVDPSIAADDFDEDSLHNGNLHSADYWRQQIVSTKEHDFHRKVYAPGTEKLIVHAENQWKMYCKDVLCSTNPKDCLSRLTFPILFNFLRWYLSQRTNKNGTRKRRVQSQQSLITFWCNFRLGVERALRMKVDRLVDTKLVANVYPPGPV